ncbi:hypothetical protein BC830DRAFT_646421 [Chytriomyces sp. MP71]|nr:hypothetical protein BC830DRAFT_646421 [Chytriomyces sp. MP71]
MKIWRRKDMLFFHAIDPMFETDEGDGIQWERFMDYYHPDLSPYFYYFRSWEHLKEIASSPNPIDTKNVRVRGPAFYETVRNKTVKGWANLFHSLGCEVKVDGLSPPFEPPLVDAPSRTELPKGVDPPKRPDLINDRRTELQLQLTPLELGGLQMRSWMRKNPDAFLMLDFPALHDAIDEKLVTMIDYVDIKLSGSTQTSGVDFKYDIVDWLEAVLKSVTKFKSLAEESYLAFAKLARMARLADTILKNLKLFHEVDILMQRSLNQSLSFVTSIAYPWLNNSKVPNLHLLSESFTKNRGIVFVIEENGFDRVFTTILTLRKYLNCTLPIQVFYNGVHASNDRYTGAQVAGDARLSKEKSLILESIPGVETVDLKSIFHGILSYVDDTEHAKPFAILAAPFKSVFYIHQDQLLFQNPEAIMNSSAVFLETGTFMLRAVTPAEQCHSQWTQNEMNAGLMAFDKTRTGVLHGLMAACHLNRRIVRGSTMNVFLKTNAIVNADRDSYWVAMALGRASFKFVNDKVAIPTPEKGIDGAKICSPPAFLDESGTLLSIDSVAWNWEVMKTYQVLHKVHLDEMSQGMARPHEVCVRPSDTFAGGRTEFDVRYREHLNAMSKARSQFKEF